MKFVATFFRYTTKDDWIKVFGCSSESEIFEKFTEDEIKRKCKDYMRIDYIYNRYNDRLLNERKYVVKGSVLSTRIKNHLKVILSILGNHDNIGKINIICIRSTYNDVEIVYTITTENNTTFSTNKITKGYKLIVFYPWSQLLCLSEKELRLHLVENNYGEVRYKTEELNDDELSIWIEESASKL